MVSRVRIRQWYLATVLAISACALPTCATVPRPEAASGRSPDPGLDVDASRAFLPLDRIEPSVGAPSPSAPVQPLTERASQRVLAARRMAQADRYTEAAIELERALRYDPNHPDIYAALAMLHWRAGNVERAADHVARAIQGNSGLAAAHYVAGRCAEQRRELDQAMTSYRTALLCNDVNADPEIAALCSYHLAEVLFAEGYLEAAATQYDQAISSAAEVSEPKDVELRGLVHGNIAVLREARSRVLEKLGRYAQAADALRPALALDGRNVARSVRYASLLLRAGRAEAALSAARDVSSDDDSVIDLIIACYRSLGHLDQAVAELRTRIERSPGDGHLISRLAGVLVDLDRSDEALELLRSHAALHPGDIVVWGRLIDATVAAQRWSEAITACAAMIRQQSTPESACVERITALASDAAAVDGLLQPRPSSVEDAAVAYLMGRVALEAERGDAALEYFERSHQRDAAFIPNRIALASAYLAAYRYDEAVRVAHRIDDAAPEDARLEVLLGRAMESLDRLEEAEQHLRAATQLDRENTEAMFRLAEVYRRLGKRNLAQQQLRVLLDADPAHEAARELLALMYMNERKTEAALEQIAELKRQSTSPTTIARCDALLDPQLRADPKARREHMLDAMQRNQPDAETWIAVAQTYGPFEVEQVREAYANAVRIDLDSDEAMLGLIDAERRLLVFDKAIEHSHELLRRRPNRHRWRLSLIELLGTAHDFDAALDMARRWSEDASLDPVRRREYRLELLRTLQWARRGDEIISLLEQWAQAEPEDTTWSQALAREYITQDQPERAIPIRQALLDAHPKDWSAVGGMLSVLAESKQVDRAAQLMLDRLDDDPESDNGVWMLAALLADADRREEAVELVRNRLVRTDQRETFQDFIIEQLQRMERHDEAVAYVESLLEEATALMQSGRDGQPAVGPRSVDGVRVARRPNEPFSLPTLHERAGVLRMRLAIALVGAKEFIDAAGRVEAWLEDTGDPLMQVQYLRLLAACQREQGNEPRATETMQRALKIQPDDVLLNNDVAYGWIDRGVRLDEAERMARFAVGARPRQGAYLDTLGWLLYKKGDFAGAKLWLARALRARGEEDPVVSDHLGDACWRLGEKTEAAKYWSAAVQSIGDREPEELASDDERRVLRVTPGKVRAAKSDESPQVAPLAQPGEDAETEPRP